MDSLASVGRAFATPHFVIAVVVGIALIIGGISMLSARPTSGPIPGTPPDNTGRIVGGVTLLIGGIIIPFAGWWRRKLIRTNPEVAALVGALDVASFARKVL